MPTQEKNNHIKYQEKEHIRQNYELWGAQGTSTDDNVGGKGAYTVGLIDLEKNDTLYIIVGGTGVM